MSDKLRAAIYTIAIFAGVGLGSISFQYSVDHYPQQTGVIGTIFGILFLAGWWGYLIYLIILDEIRRKERMRIREEQRNMAYDIQRQHEYWESQAPVSDDR